MSDWEAPLMTLVELQRRFPRGPKREGALALWLTVRVALEMGLAPAPADRHEKKRVGLLAQRLRAMAVPPALQRGLSTVLGHLEEGTPGGARVALAQLVAPAKDTLGNEAAEAVAQAARMIHEHRRAAEATR